MLSNPKLSGPVEAIVHAIVLVGAVAGAVVCVVAPHTLSFDTYTTNVLPELGVVEGLLGGAKALRLHGQPVNLGTVAKFTPEIEAVAKALSEGRVQDALVGAEKAIPASAFPSDAAETTQQPVTPPSDATAVRAAKPTETAAVQEAPAAPAPVSSDQLAAAQATLEQARAAGQV